MNNVTPNKPLAATAVYLAFGLIGSLVGASVLTADMTNESLEASFLGWMGGLFGLVVSQSVAAAVVYSFRFMSAGGTLLVLGMTMPVQIVFFLYSGLTV